MVITQTLSRLLFFASFSSGISINPDRIHPLLPTPFEFTNGSETLIIDPNDFEIVVDRDSSSSVLSAAIERYKRLMFAWDCAPNSQRHTKSLLAVVEILVADSSDVAFQLGDDESYSLSIQVGGATSQLKANTTWGALRGLESLAQLVEFSTSTGLYELRMAPWKITDKPAFAHRGVMIDTARHFLSVPSILRQIDALAYNKMNTLHWHAVDADSFPMVSLKFPALSKSGSYGSVIGSVAPMRASIGTYSVADQEMIIEYARNRGVRIVIEFDLPGHSSSWALALPHLFVECKAGPAADYGGRSHVLDPTLPATKDFLEDFVAEFGTRFPDRVMHFGGDEVDVACLNKSASVRDWMKRHGSTDPKDVYVFFERMLHTIASTHGKSVQTWADAFRAVHNASVGGHGEELPATAIGQEWGNWVGNGHDKSGIDNVRDMVRTGHRAVRSSGFYFSEGYSTGGSTITWEQIINAQIVPPGLTVEEESRVLGAEACMWGEVTDETFIDQKLWLRASILAERLWTPNQTIASYCGQKPCSYDNCDIQPRMVKNRCRMLQRGILAQPYNTQIIPDRNRWTQCELWLPEQKLVTGWALFV